MVWRTLWRPRGFEAEEEEGGEDTGARERSPPGCGRTRSGGGPGGESGEAEGPAEGTQEGEEARRQVLGPPHLLILSLGHETEMALCPVLSIWPDFALCVEERGENVPFLCDPGKDEKAAEAGQGRSRGAGRERAVRFQGVGRGSGSAGNGFLYAHTHPHSHTH